MAERGYLRPGMSCWAKCKREKPTDPDEIRVKVVEVLLEPAPGGLTFAQRGAKRKRANGEEDWMVCVEDDKGHQFNVPARDLRLDD